MTRISVRVIPNAKTSEVVGREGETFVIRLAAPPIEGKANLALIRFLADKLDCAPSEIDVDRGLSSKKKVLSVPLSLVDIVEMLR